MKNLEYNINLLWNFLHLNGEEWYDNNENISPAKLKVR